MVRPGLPDCECDKERNEHGDDQNRPPDRKPASIGGATGLGIDDLARHLDLVTKASGEWHD